MSDTWLVMVVVRIARLWARLKLNGVGRDSHVFG
jgi:hypothetical protein